MILDQTIGVHHAQIDYLTLGWMQTWVSGVPLEVPEVNSLIFVAGMRSLLDFDAGQRSYLDFEGGLR